MRVAHEIVLVVGLALSTGCNLGDDDTVTCNMMAVSGLRVTVIDGGSTLSGDECATTVWATDDKYKENLSCSVQESDCRCYGAIEREGTYNVVATRTDGASASQKVTVGSNECHVEPQEVTLEPQ